MSLTSMTVANLIGALGVSIAILTLIYGLFFYRLPPAGSAAAWNVPALLVPLAMAMALLCAGLAMAASVNPSAGGWQLVAWWGLAALFMVHTLALVLAAVRRGWHAPLASGRGPAAGRAQGPSPGLAAAVQGGLALTLVTVNLAIALAWGVTQVTAGATPPAVSTPAAPVTVATLPPPPAETATATPAPAASTAIAPAEPAAPVETSAVAPPVAPGAIALPTPTPVVPASSAPAPSLVVRSPDGVNARRAPAVDAEIVGVLADGAELPVLGISADGQWVQATQADGAIVWVARAFVELSTPAESLPVVPDAP